MCEIYLKLTIKAPESAIDIVRVSLFLTLIQILQIVVVFQLLAWNEWIPAELRDKHDSHGFKFTTIFFKATFLQFVKTASTIFKYSSCFVTKMLFIFQESSKYRNYNDNFTFCSVS